MVAKRAQTYQDLLKNRHTTQRGGSMTDIRGRLAALLLRQLYLLFPGVDWGFVFVDDFCWILRQTSSGEYTAVLLLFLLAVGCPLSWKKTVLSESEVNTWLGFLLTPTGPIVQISQDKKPMMEALLHKLAEGALFTAKEIERALGRPGPGKLRYLQVVAQAISSDPLRSS